jgi:hypothetical protein
MVFSSCASGVLSSSDRGRTRRQRANPDVEEVEKDADENQREDDEDAQEQRVEDACDVVHMFLLQG